MFGLTNFFQSESWKNIQNDVYKNSVFEFHVNGRQFFGLKKTQKILFWTFEWYQVLGVLIAGDFSIFKDAIEKFRKEKSSWFTILFQVGSIDQIVSFPSKDCQDKEFQANVLGLRNSTQTEFRYRLGAQSGLKENMPLSTIVIDLSLEEQDLLTTMNHGARQKYRKALNNNLTFHVAVENERFDFYTVWKLISEQKGFSIIQFETYKKLATYLLQTNSGQLFIAKQGDQIVSGAICIKDHYNLVYLYGAADRRFGNIGSHQFLMVEIIKRAKQNGFWTFDLFGGAPTGIHDHPLYSVSEFKESLGGTKIEFAGNYDIVFNWGLYGLFVLRKKLRKLSFGKVKDFFDSKKFTHFFDKIIIQKIRNFK